MNDKEFMALLNLYIDREIEPGEAARLEAEVRRDPRRHRMYTHYCQMHKACAIMVEQGALAAPEPGKVVPFEAAPRTTWRKPVFLGSAGVLAAAACAVAVFTLQSPVAGPALAVSSPTEAPTPMRAGAVATAPVRATPVSDEWSGPGADQVSAPDLTPVFSARQPVSLAAEGSTQLNWLSEIRPLQGTESGLTLVSAPGVLASQDPLGTKAKTGMTLRSTDGAAPAPDVSAESAQAPTEMTAFKITK